MGQRSMASKKQHALLMTGQHYILIRQNPQLSLKVGQGEVLEVIEKSNVPLTAREIAISMNSTDIKVCMHLRNLLRHNDVMCVELDRHLSLKFFNSKKKTRLYYT